MPGLRHAHTLQQLKHVLWILTPGRVFNKTNTTTMKQHKERIELNSNK